jgi:hypothetical protein
MRAAEGFRLRLGDGKTSERRKGKAKIASPFFGCVSV